MLEWLCQCCCLFCVLSQHLPEECEENYETSQDKRSLGGFKPRTSRIWSNIANHSSVTQVNCCSPSLAQLILVSGPVGTHEYIFVLSKTSTCFEMGPPLRREEGSDYYWSLPFYWEWPKRAIHTLTDPLNKGKHNYKIWGKPTKQKYRSQ
jgi:hypothetical protein